jgi:hypothetical protein
MKYFFDALDMTFHRSLLYKEVDAKGEILQHPTAMAEAYALGKEMVGKNCGMRNTESKRISQ